MRSALRVLLYLALLAGAVPAQSGELIDFEPGSWRQLAQARAGRPFIVHLWGLTCAPCRTELPEWGKLVAEKPGVEILILHAERMPPDPRMVQDMLAESGFAEEKTWAFAEGMAQALRFEIDPKWRGELPVTIFVRGDGAREMTVGPADLDAVRRWIAGQMAARKP